MSTSSLTSCASDGTGILSSCGLSSYTPISKEADFDKCPRCKVHFDFLKRTHNISSKVPLILNCKHTVCEDCIRKMAIMNIPACPVCKEKFTVLKTQLDSLTELFTPHFSLIGYLLWNKNTPTKGNVNWVSTGLTMKSKKIQGADSSFELNSDDKSDDDDEFDKPRLTLEFDKCPEHNDSFMNIHCEHCDKAVCCYCFVEAHGGHTPVYLYKLSDSEVSDLQQLKTEMEIVLRQLLLSQKKAKQLTSFDLSNVENDIKNCFFNLHAKLHSVERNVRKNLQNFKVDEADLDVVNATLKSGVYRVNHVLNLLNTTSTKQINIRALYEEVHELKKIPCCLVSDQGTLDPLEFIMSNDLFEDIEQNFVLRRSSSIEYTLLPIQDWTKCQNEEIELGSIINKVEENTLCVKEKKKSESVVSTSGQKEKKNYTKKGVSSQHEVGRTRVVLTHLNNLNSFYVQKYNVQNNLRSMNKYIGNRPKRRLTSDNVIEGRIYGVLYETKHSSYWRRGKLINIVKQGPNNFIYSIFFIDYGNTQYVTVDKLKELDLHIVKKPSYAFECKLTNPDHSEFDPKAHLRLLQLIGEKELYLQFMKRQAEGIQEVDLLIQSSGGSLISVRHLLLNAVPSSQSSSEIDLVIAKNLRFFKNSKKFQPGQEEQVKITYVKDPFNIYIQLVQNVDVLEKMKKDMLNYYQHKRSTGCVCVEGSDVVVKYKDEYQGSWHRARITSVDSANEKVGVFFVDWGKSVDVSWSDVRLLSENFIKVECQAICVKLADIESENEDGTWNQKCIDFLNQQTSINNDFKMVVNKVEPLLDVILYQTRPSADICLNTMMVEENLAISTGNFSQTLYWPKTNESKPGEDEDDEIDDEFSYQLIKKSEEVLVDIDDNELKDGLRQQVDVIRFENPNLIYVKLSKYKVLDEEMHKELQIHYSVERETKNSWKQSEYCVIYDTIRKQYFRGVIKSQCKRNAHSVYLYDHARDVKVLKSFIFIQHEYFRGFPCYVFKCRLANIKPAGDKNGEWSKLAIEMLQKIFATYKIIHIKKVESNMDLKMLGVIMWYSLSKPAKALEPSKINFISINKTLIESGVAFSTVPSTASSSSSTVRDNSDEDCTETNDENVTKKFKDWNEMISEEEKAEEEEEEQEEFLSCSTTTWPRPMSIKTQEFEAILTCVDNEGFFSLRDDDLHSLYLDLEKNLNSTFNRLDLPENSKVEWKSGEMCTIWYENSWYRGVVIDVLPNSEVSVEMIDYGSEHTVEKGHIYKQIMYPDMPPLINKVKLYDVYSKYGPNWSADDVEELLQIVTDRVKVVIKGDKNVQIPMAEVYLPTGFSVNDLIVQKCDHLFRRENKVILIDDDKDEGSEKEDVINGYVYTPLNESSDCLNDKDDNSEKGDVKGYTYAPLNESLYCQMFVMSVLKYGTSYKVVLNDNNKIDSEELDGLNLDIEERIKEQPLMVEGIEIDEPCLGYYAKKKRWCRALIYDLDNLKFGYVSIFFVDYGVIDMVSLNNLKIMKKEWFQFPVYNHMAIINIELNESSKGECVLMQMSNFSGKSVNVKIVSEDPLIVDLYEGNILCYQKLIDCGIVRGLNN